MRATIGATKYVIALIISKWTFTVSYKSTIVLPTHSSGSDWNFDVLVPSQPKRTRNFLRSNWKRRTLCGWTTWRREKGEKVSGNLICPQTGSESEMDVRQHMRKVSNFYIALIGCNEINFYCKFIDTAKKRHTRNRDTRRQHMDGAYKPSQCTNPI